ncbi:MAG: SAM-dependent methyltransferase, partial [Deltaproteobacteria bacterium]|nr:SAM-dependent methyltransferase [Deltaproteobacteria bacterium]
MSTKKEWTAGELLALSGAYWETCTLHAAVKLDLFTRIGERRVGAEALAAELGSDLRGTRMLLDALSAMGLLVKDSAGYRNTDEALTL